MPHKSVDFNTNTRTTSSNEQFTSWTMEKKIGLDLSGPYGSNNEFIFAAIDYYSRISMVEIIKATTSTSIINRLRQIFVMHGCVDEIVTDDASYFVSSELKAFLHENGIKYSRIFLPYWSLSGPPGLACWISFAPVFSFIHCCVLVFALTPWCVLVCVFWEMVGLGSFVRTRYLCVLVRVWVGGEVGAVGPVWALQWVVLLAVPGWCFFCGFLMFFFVLCLLCLWARPFVCALWSPGSYLIHLYGVRFLLWTGKIPIKYQGTAVQKLFRVHRRPSWCGPSREVT